jgi:3-hydroxyisobutyrate dehydrogenase-like beta-hydroxyacid dehydrogenase
MTAASPKRSGFIGLGTMGFPMCRHLNDKQTDAGLASVTAFDASADGIARAHEAGIPTADSASDLIAAVDILHLCLPDGKALDSVCRGDGGILERGKSGLIVMDHTTAPVPLTREIAATLAERGITLVDAPLARTRGAAESGTLAIMFGGPQDVFESLGPVLACFATDVIYCGDVGCGQVVKQMNNMVLFQNVTALAEAMVVAEAAGVANETLFKALQQGSGDSFALRNHGANAMLPRTFPERAFPATYARKDLSYALELAEAYGVPIAQAPVVMALFDEAIAAGMGEAYWPVILKQVEARAAAQATKDGSDA